MNNKPLRTHNLCTIFLFCASTFTTPTVAATAFTAKGYSQKITTIANWIQSYSQQKDVILIVFVSDNTDMVKSKISDFIKSIPFSQKTKVSQKIKMKVISPSNFQKEYPNIITLQSSSQWKIFAFASNGLLLKQIALTKDDTLTLENLLSFKRTLQNYHNLHNKDDALFFAWNAYLSNKKNIALSLLKSIPHAQHNKIVMKLKGLL